ncbi:COG4315 family predicted lipoprotein [Microlunatus soli]|uniref:COG4315 family predicted lipoprotein n=1 Tax=Microlunatus soli TaxID=630515 RepID=UPI0018D4C5C7|nr:hypothetical protein [Microlunatus soli]
MGLPLLLAACSSAQQPAATKPAPSSPAASTPAASTPAPKAQGSASIMTGSVSQGTVVVDGKGMTAYIFTKDKQGSDKSNCTGDCLAAWPPITSKTADPTAEGVTGTVDTIRSLDGTYQVTVDGWPLYTYVKDKAAGDSTGQGVGGVWYMIKPDGSRISGSEPDLGGY